MLAILLLLSYFSVVFHDVIPHAHHEDVAPMAFHLHDHHHSHNHEHEKDADHDHSSISDVLEHFNFGDSDHHHHHHQVHSHVENANYIAEQRVSVQKSTEKLVQILYPTLVVLYSDLFDSDRENDTLDFRGKIPLHASQICKDAHALRGPPSI